MKTKFAAIFSLFLILLVSCSAQEAYPSSTGNGTETPQNNTAQPTKPVPEISTTLPDVPATLPPSPESTPTVSQSSSADTITFSDNGKTFTYHVGDSFLLNLGGDVYDWTVTIDNQNVIALRVGVMVIKGAQGLFDALNPGTTTLTASGDPLCRKEVHPCGMPTVLFSVTLIVE